MKEFADRYLLEFIIGILTTVAGILGAEIKRRYEEKVNNHIKKEDAEKVVKAVEQLYKNCAGEEKYRRACLYLTEILNDKGIDVSELEVKMLIESVVAEFNKAWCSTKYDFEEDDGK